LLDQLRDRLRLRHYSLRTEQAYVHWVKRYILFHGKRHPAEMGKAEVEAFLTHLAVERHVAASTQTQALSALLFLYKEVLGVELPWLSELTRAKRPARLPTVLTREEARLLLRCVDEPTLALVVRLLYGTGMRLLEALRLRVKDVEFARREILVRDGKGGKDRVTMLPSTMRLEIVKTSLRVSAQAKNCPRSPTRLATIAQVRQAASRAAAGSSARGADAARGGFALGTWRGMAVGCAGGEIPQCRA
jgi:site-specific recombinase XerD